MERYFQIAKSNLKHNLLPHLLIACAFLIISPAFMGLDNLDAANSARVLEMYVALVGIILLTPIFLPEQNRDLRELVGAKYMSTTTITIIRLLESCICLIFIIGVFILILEQNNCVFPVMKLFLGTLADAFFLGGMGFCAYRIFDQIAIAYMLPMVIYIINFGSGKKYVQDFYLFSMIYGSYREKINLAIAGMTLILIGICYPSFVRRILPRLIPQR